MNVFFCLLLLTETENHVLIVAKNTSKTTKSFYTFGSKDKTSFLSVI